MTGTDPFDLTGRTALVTGSSRGIGRAIANVFAKHGARVAVHGRYPGEALTDATTMAPEHRVCSFAADLGERGAARDLVGKVSERLGPVDILVINASAQLRRPFLEIPAEELDAQVAVNLSATVALLQATLPGMAERGWGRVLTVGSVQQVRPSPTLAVYAALKSAQANLAINLAKQYAGRGVTVNNLAPGLIDTDRNADIKSDAEGYEAILARIPAGQAGTAEDCAWPALLLCSDAGRYVTGADLMVDGGLHLP
jgi:NAD(P)-dependent dehydrogenase (short-subunit alcohol dehydrogenase family)